MRFYSVCSAVFAVLAGLAAAGQNPITAPGVGVSLNAGDTTEILWTPTAGGKITLKLRYGPTSNLKTGVTIADSILNTGSFFWTIPANIGNGQWSIAITDGTDTDANYSPMFSISGGTGTQGSPGSASATAAPTTAAVTGSLSAFLATATGAPSSTNAARPGNVQVGMGFGFAAAIGAMVL